jgi:hypothetical protein
MLPEPPSREWRAQEPIEFPSTVHEVHRRPFGVGPAALLGGFAALALVAAIVLFAVGLWIVGIVALGLAGGSIALFWPAIRHEPGSRTARLTSRAVSRARATARFTAVRAWAWGRAGLQLGRIRRRRRRLRKALQSQLTPLGEAVYRDERERAASLKAQARELEHALERAEHEASAVLSAARQEIARERATAQPTQALPVQQTEELASADRNPRDVRSDP